MHGPLETGENMTSDFITITKIEAAERQLAQAVRMFFDRADAVSIHTLASAAYQILIDICKVRGISREMEDSKILEEMGVQKQVMNAMREPQNFFKHSHKGDADETVRFSKMLAPYMLLSASHYHYTITGTQLEECVILRTWFFISHPERAPAAMKPLLAVGDIDPTDLKFFANLLKK